MKPIKDARGEMEMHSREHVPAGPIQIRSQEWKSLLIEFRNAERRLKALDADIAALRARVQALKP
jgi:hypothetical protein